MPTPKIYNLPTLVNIEMFRLWLKPLKGIWVQKPSYRFPRALPSTFSRCTTIEHAFLSLWSEPKTTFKAH